MGVTDVADPSLVDAIWQDRSHRPGGFSKEAARRLADRYEEWLDRVQDGTAADLYVPEEVDRLLGAVQRRGRMSALYAPQEKGKTNLCAFVTELILACRPGWEVFTNVPYPWHGGGGRAPEHLHLIESDEELLTKLSERLKEGHGNSAIILDEFDQVDTSHSWSSDASQSWSKFVNVKRHYGAMGPLVVFHAFNQVPLEIRSGSTGSAFKLVVRGGEHTLIDLENLDEWVATIDRSVLPHLTYGLRGFELCVDFGALQRRFRGSAFRGDPAAVAEETLRFLEEARDIRAAEEAERSEQLRAEHAAVLTEYRKGVIANTQAKVERETKIIRAFRERPGLTIREAAALFSASHQYLVRLRERALRQEPQLSDTPLPVSAEAA